MGLRVRKGQPNFTDGSRVSGIWAFWAPAAFQVNAVKFLVEAGADKAGILSGRGFAFRAWGAGLFHAQGLKTLRLDQASACKVEVPRFHVRGGF